MGDPYINSQIHAQPTDPKNEQDNASEIPAMGYWRDLNGYNVVDIQNGPQLLNQSTTTSNTSRTFDGRASFVHHTAGLLSSASVVTKANGSKDHKIPSESIASCPFQQSHDSFKQTDDIGLISNTNHASIIDDTVDTHIQPHRQDQDSTCILEAAFDSSALNQDFLPNCDPIPCSDFNDSDLLLDLSILDDLERT